MMDIILTPVVVQHQLTGSIQLPRHEMKVTAMVLMAHGQLGAPMMAMNITSPRKHLPMRAEAMVATASTVDSHQLCRQTKGGIMNMVYHLAMFTSEATALVDTATRGSDLLLCKPRLASVGFVAATVYYTCILLMLGNAKSMSLPMLSQHLSLTDSLLPATHLLRSIAVTILLSWPFHGLI